MKIFSKETLSKVEGTLVVKVGAEWCGPCRQLDPIIDEIQNEGYELYDVDIDDDMTIATEYGIRSVPTFLIFEGGEIKDKKIGTFTKKELIKFFD